MKKQIFFFVVVLALVGCSSTNFVSIPVVQPPAIPIPPVVKKIGIIDRSKSDSKLNKIDQLLSMESSKLEKEGAREAVNGLASELKLANRFEKTEVIDGLHLRSKGMGLMDKPLDWTLLKDICEKNDVDVLFVLEAYDTDTHVDVQKYVEVTETPRGEIHQRKTAANLNVTVKGGWRIYDPYVNQIVDQRQFSKSFNYGTSRVTPVVAISGAMNRASAIRDLSYRAGQDYAHKVLAHDIRVSRRYYVRGTDNFKTAKRFARTGNWKEAAELWQKETVNNDLKVAGRAYYNMAIANEINGNLDMAIDWASKSYEKYGNKKALGYLNMLKRRKSDEQLLDELQMK